MAEPSPLTRTWQAIRDLPGRTPLRVKLITAVLALAAIALAVISIAGISVLRSYLLNQSDNTLQGYTNYVEGHLGQYVGEVESGGQPNSSVLAVALVQPGGKLQWLIRPAKPNYGLNPSLFGPGPPPQFLPGPQVPDNAGWLAANMDQFVTVPAQSGGDVWRVLVQPVTFTNGSSTISGTMIVGIKVTSVYSTIGRLAGLDLIVSALLLLVILIVGIAVVRASLRPLTDIEKTAGAIAAGDLTRRVPDRDPRTEVGRLGRSLNAMLSQIEAAFDARAESEFAARSSEERMRRFVADASHELRTPLTAIRGFAEYYRQRGGVTEIPGAPGRPALDPGADTDEAGPADDGASPADYGAGPADYGPGPAAQDAETTEYGAEPAGYGAGPAEYGAGPADYGAFVSPRHGSNAEPIRTGPLTRPDLDRIMQRVEQESSRMGILVEDMLLLARLDQQRPLEHRPVDMLTLAADAVHDARVVAPDRSINLTVGAGAALLVLGDEVRLRQVIGNLMSNALHHTPDGTPIEVRVRSGNLDEWSTAAAGVRPAPADHDAQPSPAVVLEVADQGAGLTPTQAQHVFERFYRGDQARTRPGGTGLGLAIVASLVAAHGGRVWVESTPGRGATFRIAIPLAPEARHIGPDPEDSTNPDILNSRRTLSPRPADPPEPRHEGQPAGPGLPKRRPGISGHARR
jgi:two-component system, OmpR family, sensor kinase